MTCPLATCSRCKREIPEGEPYWSLTRLKERVVAGVIQVDTVDTLGNLCGDCAEARPSVYQFLRDPLALSPNI